MVGSRWSGGIRLRGAYGVTCWCYAGGVNPEKFLRAENVGVSPTGASCGEKRARDCPPYLTGDGILNRRVGGGYRAMSCGCPGSPCEMVRRGPRTQNFRQFHGRSINIWRNLCEADGSK